MPSWVDIVPTGLLARAYVSGSELAWDKANALRVIDVLEAHQFVVIGVDIWLPTEGAPTIPTPGVYDWTLGQISADARRRGDAYHFVETFAWDMADRITADQPPFFNLWVEHDDTPRSSNDGEVGHVEAPPRVLPLRPQ